MDIGAGIESVHTGAWTLLFPFPRPSIDPAAALQLNSGAGVALAASSIPTHDDPLLALVI